MPSTFRSALSPLGDADSVAHGVVSSAAVAALTLIDPRVLTPGRRLGYRAAMAGLTAWSTWALLRTEAGAALSAGARLGMVVGAAGATLGIAEAGEALDARLHDRVRAAGIDRPRALLAAAAGAISIGGWWLGRRSDAAAATAVAGVEDEPAEELVEVPDDVRALADRLLAATDGFGAPELRSQLAAARAVRWEGPEPEGFWPGIGFAVPAGAPLAVPGDANLPVIGRYTAVEGRSFDVMLGVQDGRLAMLSISEGRDWSDDERIAWIEADRGVHELQGWPSPDELELLVETPDGLRPIG
ncbi:hypothetical protein [Agrococcus citreus]|uniref:Uncharacterized protein n=1 Tax=Agrococcus citreus TaxID=84643 RepID=A0ABP4JER4_9MICO